MTTPSGKKAGRKKRGPRVKKSVLSDIHKCEINWRDWAPQFVALLPLLDSDSVVADFTHLRESVAKYTGRTFDGTVASWREASIAEPASIAMVRQENPRFFSGTNAALFKLFGFPSPTLQPSERVEPLTAKDVAGLVIAFKGLDAPHAPDSTRVKALWLLGLVPEDDHLANLCATYLGGDKALAGDVRASWSAQIAMRNLEPDVEWAAQFISWGLENTPCVVSQYDPPDPAALARRRARADCRYDR